MAIIELWIVLIVAVATWRWLHYTPRDRFVCWHCATKRWVRWSLLLAVALLILAHGQWHWPDFGFLALALASELG